MNNKTPKTLEKQYKGNCIKSLQTISTLSVKYYHCVLFSEFSTKEIAVFHLIERHNTPSLPLPPPKKNKKIYFPNTFSIHILCIFL